jgi:hypothetical protein
VRRRSRFLANEFCPRGQGDCSGFPASDTVGTSRGGQSCRQRTVGRPVSGRWRVVRERVTRRSRQAAPCSWTAAGRTGRCQKMAPSWCQKVAPHRGRSQAAWLLCATALGGLLADIPVVVPGPLTRSPPCPERVRGSRYRTVACRHRPQNPRRPACHQTQPPTCLPGLGLWWTVASLAVADPGGGGQSDDGPGPYDRAGGRRRCGPRWQARAWPGERRQCPSSVTAGSDAAAGAVMCRDRAPRGRRAASSRHCPGGGGRRGEPRRLGGARPRPPGPASGRPVDAAGGGGPGRRGG